MDSANAEKAIKQLHGKVRNLNYFLAWEEQSGPGSLEMFKGQRPLCSQIVFFDLSALSNSIDDSAEKREIKIEPNNMTCDLWSRLLTLFCFLEYFIDLWARAKRMITGELDKSMPTCPPVLYRFTRCFLSPIHSFRWKKDGYLACERLRPAHVLPIAQTRICPKSLPSKQNFVPTVTFFVVDHHFGLILEETLSIIYLLAFPACLQTSTNQFPLLPHVTKEKLGDGKVFYS